LQSDPDTANADITLSIYAHLAAGSGDDGMDDVISVNKHRPAGRRLKKAIAKKPRGLEVIEKIE